jgi:hypothetical protein
MKHRPAPTLDGHPKAGEYREPRSDSSLRLAAAPMRKSSLRRIEKLHVLVAQLIMRDIEPNTVVTVLMCSPSAARNYVEQLRDAGLIKLVPVRSAAGRVGRTAYRLHHDRERVSAFLTTLSEPGHGGKISTRNGGHAIEPRSHRRFHIMRDDVGISLRISNAPAQRDPLVAALFGAPRFGVEDE